MMDLEVKKMIQMRYKIFVLSVSFENYTTGYGGTDKLIREHQKVLNLNNISLLHIFPIHKPQIENIIGHSIWGVLNDGKIIGYFSLNQLIAILNDLTTNYEFKGFVLHHFQWTNIDEIDELLDCCHSSILCYLHDFRTICPQGGLIKNDQEFCGSSFPDEQKCKGCKYQTDNNTIRYARIRELFTKYVDRIEFVAPSDACRDIWVQAYPLFGKKVRIVPHQVMEGYYKGNNTELQDEHIRIGFVGYQKELKGWSDWVKACERLNNNTQYELYQFGQSEQVIDGVEKVEVDFQNIALSMTNQLRTYNIDCAVLWSKVPETYSYTYFEAMSANCFILTNENSGNIANMVKKYGNGYVASKDESLESILLNTERLIRMINAFRDRHLYGPQKLVENDEIVGIVSQLPTGRIEIHKKISVTERITSTILMLIDKIRKR